jgi:hypothetical protein
MQVPAHAQGNPAVAECKTIVDRAADLVRSGETARARELQPQVRHRLPLLKAAQLRAARELEKRHEDVVRRSKGQPI